MQSRITRLVFGVSSFIFGGIIGAIIENQINSGISVGYLAILVLAIASFTTTFMVLSSLEKREEYDDQVLSSIADVEKRIGLKVLYQELKEIGLEDNGQVDHLAGLMKDAEFEILEVGDSKVHEQQVNSDLPPPMVRQEYYDSILKRVETQTAKGVDFVYKRIIQFPHINGTFRSLGDNIYVDHCKQMLILNQSKGIRAYVKRTVATSSISFLIIDRQYLVICVNAIRHLRNTSEQYLKGEIIIRDPQQELITVFLREWERIENSPYTQTATVEEF